MIGAGRGGALFFKTSPGGGRPAAVGMQGQTNREGRRWNTNGARVGTSCFVLASGRSAGPWHQGRRQPYHTSAWVLGMSVEGLLLLAFMGPPES